MAATLATLLSGCGLMDGSTTTTTTRSRASTDQADAVATPPGWAARRSAVVARNLDVPWGLVFLPGGGILVGQRDRASILLLRPNGSRQVARKLTNVAPNGDSGGEAGLLGLALSPRFTVNHWVYAYISSPHDNRVVKMRWTHGRLGRQHRVFAGIPRSLHHNGGRIAFGPDGMLYVTTGDAEVSSRAQNRRALGGKILRMTPRGRPAPGNPFHRSVVYSIGHRNVEGLDWDSSGRLWATEFGDHAYDEINLIRPGRNYGWPVVEGRSHRPRFTDPVVVWRTEEAGPSGIAIASVHGRTVAFVGAVTGQRLWRVVLHGTEAGKKTAVFVGTRGRIRTTAVARGRLWITTSNTDGRATPRAGDDKLIRVRLR